MSITSGISAMISTPLNVDGTLSINVTGLVDLIQNDTEAQMLVASTNQKIEQIRVQMAQVDSLIHSLRADITRLQEIVAAE